jgi:hypothetical protein
MSHKEQIEYCLSIKSRFPSFFEGKKVLDCGSLDINGNNRYLFESDGWSYTGVDIGEGLNVDIVTPTHQLAMADESVGFVISTEMLEHDMYYEDSLNAMVRILKPGGMLLFTCATTGRAEHGTRRTTPTDAPLLEGEWSDYYKNLTEKDIQDISGFLESFECFEFEVQPDHNDLGFWGIKKDQRNA